MARSRKQSAGALEQSRIEQNSVFPAPNPPRYVNVYLNEQDIAWLEENDAVADARVTEFLDSLTSGYGISLYQEKSSGKWNAVLSCNDDYDPNNGHKLSVRTSNAFDSMYALAYAHHVKLSKSWRPSDSTPTSRWG